MLHLTVHCVKTCDFGVAVKVLNCVEQNGSWRVRIGWNQRSEQLVLCQFVKQIEITRIALEKRRKLVWYMEDSIFSAIPKFRQKEGVLGIIPRSKWQQFGVSQKIDKRTCNIIVPRQVTTACQATKRRIVIPDQRTMHLTQCSCTYALYAHTQVGGAHCFQIFPCHAIFDFTSSYTLLPVLHYTIFLSAPDISTISLYNILFTAAQLYIDFLYFSILSTNLFHARFSTFWNKRKSLVSLSGFVHGILSERKVNYVNDMSIADTFDLTQLGLIL